MPERSRTGEKARRPTAVDDVMWRFAERRALDLGVDFDELLDQVSSRSTAWRSRKQGASPQMLRKVEARLTEIEEERGAKSSRSRLLEEWKDMGAELLLLDDESVHFKQAAAGVREVLAAGRKFQEALAVFRKKV